MIQGRPSLNNSNNTNAGTGGVGVGNKGWSEIAWAAKDELGEYVKDKNTLELLQKMLYTSYMYISGDEIGPGGCRRDIKLLACSMHEDRYIEVRGTK